MTDADDPWAEYAADWDDDEGARIYSRAAFSHLLELLEARGPELRGAVVCDFGCGTGLLSEQFVDTVERVDAVDASPAMLDQLRAKIEARGWTNVHPSSTIPESPGEHDLVVCSSVLSFVDDLDATVAGLAALLRPGGALIHWDWERTDDHDHGLTRHESRRALERAGLRDVFVDAAFEFRIEGEPVRPIAGIGWRGGS